MHNALHERITGPDTRAPLGMLHMRAGGRIDCGTTSL